MPLINLDAVLNPLPELKDHILDYVPRATTSEFGIVALGSGINVDIFGRIYLDTQEYSDRLAAIETTAASTLETTVNTLETKAFELAASITQKLGTPNGIATLDSAGSIPSSQLPSYVDDVLEYASVVTFPATGETGKIYVETIGNTAYRWSGTTYVKITSGEVSSVAGKKGIVTLTKDDVGLSNVDNTNDLNKPLSTATQTALTALENKGKRGIINLYDISLIYGLNERVVLANGDIVKSTVANNTVDPNVDMTGWINTDLVLKSVSEMLSIVNPRHGMRISVKSYHDSLGVGGGFFVYDSLKSSLNDEGLVINGWVREVVNSTVSVFDFGAKASRGYDSLNAFNSITLILARGYDALVPQGEFSASGLVGIKTVDGCKVDWVGMLYTDFGVRVGAASSFTIGAEIDGIRVSVQNGRNWNANTGVHLYNMSSCYVRTKDTVGFENGVILEGEGQAFQSNQIYLGRVRSSKYSLTLTSSGSGWCNENLIFGGSFNFGSDVPLSEKDNCVHLRTFNGLTTCNNNRFFAPHFEASREFDWLAFDIGGQNNSVLYPRLEKANKVKFNSTSNACFLKCVYTLVEGNIIDEGWLNQYETTFFTKKSTASTTLAPIRGLNRASGLAPAIAALSTNGDTGTYLARDGVCIGGGSNDPFIYKSGVSPQGKLELPIGSLCLVTSTNAAVVGLYIKVAAGNTGWKKVTVNA